MRSLQRVALSIALTFAPAMGTGCVNTRQNVAYSRSSEHCHQKMTQARLEESRGNLAEAKRLFAEVHQQDPQNAECLHRLAVICTHLDQLNEADAYYTQANSLKPNDPEILSDMGYAAFLIKNYDQSEKLLEQSVSLRDNDRRTITNLAIVRAWRGQDDSSLTTFRRVNSESEALRNLAAIQIARGDKEQGLAGYQLAKNFDSRSASASNAIAQTGANDLPPLPDDLASVPVPLQMTASFSIAMQSVPPSPRDNNDSCTRTAGPDTLIEAPLPPPASTLELDSIPTPPAPPLPVKDDYDTEATPPEKTPSKVKPQASLIDQDLITSEFDLEIMYKPIVASPPAPAADPVVTAEGNPIRSQQGAKVRPSSAWRKTPPLHANKASHTLNEANVQQASASLDRATDKSNVWNICLVTLFEEKRLAPASGEFSMEYRSQQYRFSSAEALEKFRAAPHQYAPVAGGLDVVSVKKDRSVESGSLNFALWYQRKLYLFSSSEHAEAFRRDPQSYSAAN